MREEVLHERIFMESEAHVRHYDVIDVCKQSAGWVIAEFPGPKGIEFTDPANQPTLLGDLFVDEGGEGTETHKPGSLDEVHCWNKYYSQIKAVSHHSK